MIANPILTWEIKQREGETLVIFQGNINETSDFTKLESLSGKVIFDLAGVHRLNSDGVRRWVEFIRRLDGVSELIFQKCSIAIVSQLNMVRGFKGQARIESFYAPYICPRTEEEEERLLTVQEISDPTAPPTFPCSGGTLELDDIPERYFAFLADEI